MKKFLVIILMAVIFLNSCNPIATPSLLPSPVATVTSLPAFTPIPTQIIEPIPTQTATPMPHPFFDTSRFSFVTLNSITSVPLSELLYDKWIVGNDGLVFRFNVESGVFSRIDTPVKANLYDVDFVSSDDGWIVGEDSLILHWNGEDWEVSKPAVVDSRGHYSYDLYNVSFNEANDGWAAGCTGTEGGEYFLVYHWDGTTWSEVSLSEEGNLWACVHDILTLSSTDVWMVGTGWESGKEYGFTVHWDGNNWKIFTELVSYNISSLSAVSSDNIWAITRNGTTLNWNGAEWKENAKLDVTDSYSAPILHAQASDDVYVAGHKIWHWDGNDWTDISSLGNIEVDSNIIDIVAFPSPAFPLEIWMLDSSGIMYTFQYRLNFR